MNLFSGRAVIDAFIASFCRTMTTSSSGTRSAPPQGHKVT